MGKNILDENRWFCTNISVNHSYLLESILTNWYLFIFELNTKSVSTVYLFIVVCDQERFFEEEKEEKKKDHLNGIVDGRIIEEWMTVGEEEELYLEW